MTEVNFEVFSWGPPLLKFQLPKDELNSVIEISKRAKVFDHSHRLVGQVEQQLKFTKEDSSNILLSIGKYFDCYTEFVLGPDYEEKLNLNGMWINHMEDGDYNPIHIHGGHITFVLYTYVSDELKLEQSRSPRDDIARPGDICFTFGPQMTNTPILPIAIHNFSPDAGQLFIFPTYLSHLVYPFKSKGMHRSSISGNFTYE